MAPCLLSEIALAIAEGAEMNRVARWAENTASKHFLAVLALAAAIPCWAQNPGPADGGQQSRVVLVSLVDRKLAVIENGVVIATFQVAVGAKVSPSPTGEFTIVSRVTNPTYYHRGTVIAAGKDNPVGTRWVGLTLKGYLRNRDVERLFTMLRIGDRVQIRGERDEQVARVFGGQTDQTVVASAQDPSQNEQQEATQSAVGLGN
ncbi:MAG: L,D-transpeptidase [Acidobacteria bacterium]|nr:MAG: L,D-transpeptidase [Acidobacteriota bacterium]